MSQVSTFYRYPYITISVDTPIARETNRISVQFTTLELRSLINPQSEAERFKDKIFHELLRYEGYEYARDMSIKAQQAYLRAVEQANEIWDKLD